MIFAGEISRQNNIDTWRSWEQTNYSSKKYIDEDHGVYILYVNEVCSITWLYFKHFFSVTIVDVAQVHINISCINSVTIDCFNGYTIVDKLVF